MIKKQTRVFHLIVRKIEDGSGLPRYSPDSPPESLSSLINPECGMNIQYFQVFCETVIKFFVERSQESFYFRWEAELLSALQVIQPLVDFVLT